MSYISLIFSYSNNIKGDIKMATRKIFTPSLNFPQIPGTKTSIIDNDFFITENKSCTESENILYEQRIRIIENPNISEEEKQQALSKIDSNLEEIRYEKRSIHHDYINKKETPQQLTNKIWVCGILCIFVLMVGGPLLINSRKN